jgi:hypothetical protein
MFLLTGQHKLLSFRSCQANFKLGASMPSSSLCLGFPNVVPFNPTSTSPMTCFFFLLALVSHPVGKMVVWASLEGTICILEHVGFAATGTQFV